jgi:hypothetical protein
MRHMKIDDPHQPARLMHLPSLDRASPVRQRQLALPSLQPRPHDNTLRRQIADRFRYAPIMYRPSPHSLTKRARRETKGADKSKAQAPILSEAEVRTAIPGRLERGHFWPGTLAVARS